MSAGPGVRPLDGAAYGALGLPLAFVALPLYVQLPHHYATAFGVPLATLGTLLLAARALDAVVDPLIGRQVDRWFARSARRVLATAVPAAAVMALGFAGLFFPPVREGSALVVTCALLLVVTYLAYSLLSVLHQSWGARLGGDEAMRTRVVAWREGFALAGVLVASVLPSLAGYGTAGVVLAVALAAGVALLARAPRPEASAQPPAASMRTPFGNAEFRGLLAVYLVNGIASAVPATLVLFFVRDRLQAPAWEPVFLAAYFAAGALSMPLWVRAVQRLGLAPSWLAAMALAVASFAWAALLGPGDHLAYAAVCVASGFALGADLSLPGALLAGVIQRAGHAGRLEGAYFGWWNCAGKLNLALAAGLALPLLQWAGYEPGARDAQALHALALAYCALPCALKAAAAALLWRRVIRPNPGSPS